MRTASMMVHKQPDFWQHKQQLPMPGIKCGAMLEPGPVITAAPNPMMLQGQSAVILA